MIVLKPQLFDVCCTMVVDEAAGGGAEERERREIKFYDSGLDGCRLSSQGGLVQQYLNASNTAAAGRGLLLAKGRIFGSWTLPDLTSDSFSCIGEFRDHCVHSFNRYGRMDPVFYSLIDC
jgi:hypothetical protein